MRTAEVISTAMARAEKPMIGAIIIDADSEFYEEVEAWLGAEIKKSDGSASVRRDVGIVSIYGSKVIGHKTMNTDGDP